MTLPDLAYLTLLAAAVCLYLGDGLNSVTAAVRELLEVNRRDKP